MSALNDRQKAFLGTDLTSGRVHQRTQGGRSFSYLEAWDIRRHLIRTFGYCGFSTEVLDAECVVDRPTKTSAGKDAFTVAYKVRLRLTVPGAVYTEVAIASATLPDLGQAHDMAVKSSESDALKRCAVNLGTQFGLSLYDNGAKVDVVKWTLDGEKAPGASETPEDAPVAPEGQPAETTTEMTPEQASETTPAERPNVGTDVDPILAELRAVYTLDTAAAKVQRVAEIRLDLTAEALGTIVTIQGSQMSIDRLADKVVSDALASVAS